MNIPSTLKVLRRSLAATVTLRDPNTGAVVAEATTNLAGIGLIADIPEGGYDLEVRADRHAIFRGVCIVAPGITSEAEIFLPRQLVTYRWVVVPTAIQDHYTITLVSEFETDVLAPVVTIETSRSEIPELDPGETFQTDLIIRNHGTHCGGESQSHCARKRSLRVHAPGHQPGRAPCEERNASTRDG